MTLKSDTMNLSESELAWLPVWGRTGKLAMRWSCYLNRNMYQTNEQIFENLAKTRREALIGWADHKWSFLESMARRLEGVAPDVLNLSVARAGARLRDIAELFVVTEDGRDGGPGIDAGFRFPAGQRSVGAT